MEKATSRYERALNSERVAVDYLMNSRGLTKETIQEFRLGVVADPLPGHEHVRGWISIPYLTPDDSVVSLRFRRLGDGGGSKYLSIAGDAPRLFNAKILNRGDLTWMCTPEGEFDAMIAVQCGVPAVGIPGAQSWQRRWYRLFTHYNLVCGLHDDDEAGRDLAHKIAESLDNFRPVPMTAPAPGVKGDVTNLVLHQGPDALRKKLVIA
ncbi:toprim domain-containing protein [Actinomadura rubrisoli]|uniref:Topoisomerase n=1 Tax=Actinomadura rubrisoli TaxID=2530368 RepID=A0A4R5CIQ8_9ACTN|nr:toprim domain-containing protein [Actinomadura rubrisoli]TDD97224.1 topoisomerase [Actinomadura rubrisoli]